MRKILFVDFYNIAPHLETSFELAKRHLDEGDDVTYYFLGHDLPYREHIVFSKPERWLFRFWQPERRAARLIRSQRFRFIGRVGIDATRYQTEVPSTLASLKAWSHDGADLGMGVASSLISGARNSRFDPAANSSTVALALASSVAVYEYCKRLFERHQPDRVYVFNGRWCLTRAALRAAERSGAEVRIHERGADMHRFVVRDYIPHDREKLQADIVLHWEEHGNSDASHAEAVGWYEERRLGEPRDWTSFTSLQKPDLVPALPSGKRIVTYFSSSDDEQAAIGEAYRWVGWKDQYDAVRNLIEVAKQIPEVQLVIRLHPHLLKKHPEDRQRWLDLARSGGVAIVVEPESPVDSYALLEASDVIVTGGSTIGMEAIYWGRRSILLGPSDYDLLGVVEVAQGRKVLEELLRQTPEPVNKDAAIPYAFYRATFGEEFIHYRATSLFSGQFLGEDLQRLPHVPGLVNKVKVAVLRSYRARRPARRPTTCL